MAGRLSPTSLYRGKSRGLAPDASEQREQPRSCPHRTSPVIATLRLLIGAGAAVTLLSTPAIGFQTDGATPFDYVGYFTNLTSLLAALVFLATGLRGLSGRADPSCLAGSRAVSVSCMLVVGVISNSLIPGTGSAPPWVSLLRHAIFPKVVRLDWAIVGDRDPLPRRILWVVLPYPIVWSATVLLRGITDGWVPDGFLLPSNGVASVLAHACGLLAALLGAAAIVWGLSMWRGWAPMLAESGATRRSEV